MCVEITNTYKSLHSLHWSMEGKNIHVQPFSSISLWFFYAEGFLCSWLSHSFGMLRASIFLSSHSPFFLSLSLSPANFAARLCRSRGFCWVWTKKWEGHWVLEGEVWWLSNRNVSNVRWENWNEHSSYSAKNKKSAWYITREILWKDVLKNVYAYALKYVNPITS